MHHEWPVFPLINWALPSHLIIKSRINNKNQESCGHKLVGNSFFVYIGLWIYPQLHNKLPCFYLVTLCDSSPCIFLMGFRNFLFLSGNYLALQSRWMPVKGFLLVLAVPWAPQFSRSALHVLVSLSKSLISSGSESWLVHLHLPEIIHVKKKKKTSQQLDPYVNIGHFWWVDYLLKIVHLRSV